MMHPQLLHCCFDKWIYTSLITSQWTSFTVCPMTWTQNLADLDESSTRHRAAGMNAPANSGETLRDTSNNLVSPEWFYMHLMFNAVLDDYHCPLQKSLPESAVRIDSAIRWNSNVGTAWASLSPHQHQWHWKIMCQVFSFSNNWPVVLLVQAVQSEDENDLENFWVVSWNLSLFQPKLTWLSDTGRTKVHRRNCTAKRQDMWCNADLCRKPAKRRCQKIGQITYQGRDVWFDIERFPVGFLCEPKCQTGSDFVCKTMAQKEHHHCSYLISLCIKCWQRQRETFRASAHCYHP